MIQEKINAVKSVYPNAKWFVRDNDIVEFYDNEIAFVIENEMSVSEIKQSYLDAGLNTFNSMFSILPIDERKILVSVYDYFKKEFAANKDWLVFYKYINYENKIYSIYEMKL